jgi:putative hydrolase of the HAD superfamily
MIKRNLVTFDLDDTLYAERDFVKSGFVAVAVHLEDLGIVSHEIFFNAAWQLFEEGTRSTIFNQVFEVLNINSSPELIFELVEVYRNHFPDIQSYDKAAYLLDTLKEEGAGLALISDGPPQTQRNKLSALCLENYFNQIIFTGAYGSGWSKPSPLAFLEVMRLMEVEAENCIYVADNPKKDFLGPNRLGWKTIRFCYKSGLYFSELPPQGGEPDKTVQNYEELCDLLL